uniref:cyclic AMP-responsive element-binding protein 3-like protein 4 n=1 Tax=Myxine glutinosa TaxID=7769 RepID=UPI00358F1B61
MMSREEIAELENGNGFRFVLETSTEAQNQVLMESPFVGSSRFFEDWQLDNVCTSHGSEAESLLSAVLHSDEVHSAVNALHSPRDSDSGISEQSESSQCHGNTVSAFVVPSNPTSSAALLEQCHIKREEPSPDSNIISIEFDDEWNARIVGSDTFLGDTIMPNTSAVHESSRVIDVPLLSDNQDCPSLMLLEEEKSMLEHEGISLPAHLPLTKTEERVLKKIRRKIRNKQSAQASRRRKKEYVDGLENRMTDCNEQNQNLKHKLDQLQNQNLSLLAQLSHLQTMVKRTSKKASQTSTCLMVFLCCFVLLVLPSYNPFSKGKAVEESHIEVRGASRALKGIELDDMEETKNETALNENTSSNEYLLLESSKVAPRHMVDLMHTGADEKATNTANEKDEKDTIKDGENRSRRTAATVNENIIGHDANEAIPHARPLSEAEHVLEVVEMSKAIRTDEM